MHVAGEDSKGGDDEGGLWATMKTTAEGAGVIAFWASALTVVTGAQSGSIMVQSSCLVIT